MKKIIYIEGMHCDACVTLIKNKFLKVINGIKKVDINLAKKEAVIEYDSESIDIEYLDSLIKPLGYKIALEKPKKNYLGELVLPFLISIIIIALFLFIQRAGLIESFTTQKQKIDLLFAFITGIIASISSCFAIVGSIVISFNTLYKDSNNNRGILNLLKSNILFQIGRLITFFLLGGLLGLIGGTLSLSGRFLGIVNILIAVIMLWLGLNILNIVPSITTLFKIPDFFTKNITKYNSKFKFMPLVVGFITFFLPCGFTQSMQIFALSAGSFIKGGLLMFLFALGTLPVLFIIGITAKLSQNPNLIIFRKIGAFLIIFFAIYTFFNGMAVINFKGNLFNANITENKDSSNLAELKNEEFKKSEEIQVIRMSVKYYGFEPQVLKIKKGIKVRWEIYGDEVTGCTNAIVFPYIKKRFGIKNKDTIIIEFMPPDKKTFLPFSCWMGMVRGIFLVE